MSLRKMPRAGWAAALVVLVVAASVATAAQSILTASDVGVIVDPAVPGDIRFLVRFEVPEVLSEGVIELAVLEFAGEVTSPDSAGVELDAFLVTTRWEGTSVDWVEGWNAPGGDVAQTFHGLWVAGRGEGSAIKFDVTDMVAAWAAGERENCGLIVARAPGETGSMRAACVSPAGGDLPRLKLWVTPRRDG